MVVLGKMFSSRDPMDFMILMMKLVVSQNVAAQQVI